MPETVQVDENVEEVSCDGGKTFGHPRIYMAFGDENVLECYYCGRRFERRGGADGEARHDAA